MALATGQAKSSPEGNDGQGDAKDPSARGQSHFALQNKHLCAGAKSGQSPPRLSAAIKEELTRRDWNGNVRELRNAIEHAIVLARGGNLMPEHLPDPVAATHAETATDDPQQIATLVSDWAAAKLRGEPNAAELHNDLLKLVEPPLLEEALKHSHGQYVAAARKLGLHRTTVKKKLGQYGMESEETAE